MRPPVAERPPATPAASGWNGWWVVFFLQAAFIVGAAVLAAAAELRPLATVAVIALAWALVAVADVLVWRHRKANAQREL